jgi:hypothetical protein
LRRFLFAKYFALTIIFREIYDFAKDILQKNYAPMLLNYALVGVSSPPTERIKGVLTCHSGKSHKLVAGEKNTGNGLEFICNFISPSITMENLC